MKKAKSAKLAEELEQLPNIGKQIAADLRGIGISSPALLKNKDPYKLYIKVCEKTKSYKDPCLLDVFISAVDFLNGGRAKPWWSFTDERKRNFDRVDQDAERFKK